MHVSMDYIWKYGLASSSNYPLNYRTYLTGKVQPCRSVAGKPRYRIPNWYYTFDRSCHTQIRVVLSGRTLATLIYAPKPLFYYRGGVITSCPVATPNHAMVIVGVRIDTNSFQRSYLKLKNSWGINWGEQGNVRVWINNVCNSCIASFYSF